MTSRGQNLQTPPSPCTLGGKSITIILPTVAQPGADLHKDPPSTAGTLYKLKLPESLALKHCLVVHLFHFMVLDDLSLIFSSLIAIK